MLKLEKDGKCQYKVYWENGVHIGEYTMMEDGYYVFFPLEKYGYWNEHSLNLLKKV